MKWTATTIFAVGLLSMSGNAWAQPDPSTIDFVAAGPADWNVAGSWNAPGFGAIVPGDGFPAEIASISNGEIAELTSPALFDVTGVVIGETHDPNRAGGPNATEEEGTLNISGAGALNVTGPGANGTAALRIGDAGRGVLNFSGGAVSTEALSVGGAADSALNLSGNATLAVSANASIQRITAITGPNVLFDVEGDLRVRGTFVPVITGPTHSAISAVAGTANLGGTLQVRFSGHSPSVGDSWTLIDADDVIGKFTVDASQAAGLARGAAFDVSYNDGGSGDVVLSVNNKLILTVDRVTGAATIENAVAAAIDFDSYTIRSAGGLLSVGNWTSLNSSGVAGPNWAEANPTANHISELNLLGSTMAAAGNALSLGSPYVGGPILPTEEDLLFEYSTTDGVARQGIIEYTGPINDLVLRVDPTTGEAAIQNLSTFFSADIDSYTIFSPSASLDPAGFDSFEQSGAAGAGWFEANPTSEHISELNLTSSTLFSTGTSIPIGNIFAAGGVRDLTFQYSAIGGGGGPVGDTNGDGVVNIDDLNNVRNNFGGAGIGDTNGDGVVNIDDLNNVRNHFGETGGGGGGPAGIFFGTVEYGPLGGLNAVPEPASVALLGWCLMCVLPTTRRKEYKRS